VNPDGNDDIFLLSERVSQDSVENYFAQQRARGGRNDNPTFEQCLKNAGALRLQKSMALDPVRGNCSRKRRLFSCQDVVPADVLTPLPKRCRSMHK